MFLNGIFSGVKTDKWNTAHLNAVGMWEGND